MNLDVSNSAEAERNFYLQLLDLGTALEPEPLLEQTLATLAAASGAKAAYFELRDHDDNGDTPPRYWKAHRCSDRAIASIRASIIPQTLAEGWTIVLPSTNSSLRDPDVSSDEIHVALCAPIGLPPLGFVYLQGVHSDVSFAVRNRGMIEVLASQLAMIADRLSSRQNRAGQIGATTEIRKRFRCEELVGHSPAFARMLREAALAAPLHTPVLIAGGSGTGKSVLARAIASNSARASGPYVNFHCVTIPHLLFVSELFGLGPAAHSGAPRGSYGKVAEANGGTLFLDEISEMSLDAQAKLLQLLQEHCYYPPGATTPVVADVRVICATNMDLIAQVERGAFLDDLYYRLAVLPIVVPSLDERRDDIPELVERFCAEFCARYHLVALRPTRRALMACREAQWLGNVRELANAINAAVMLAVSEHAPAIDHYHVFPEMARSGDPLTDREAAERRDLVEALARNDWSIPRAAVDLGLSRTLVHHLMGSLGIRRPSDED
jgi:Nif-specific regulatory protein